MKLLKLLSYSENDTEQCHHVNGKKMMLEEDKNMLTIRNKKLMI